MVSLFLCFIKLSKKEAIGYLTKIANGLATELN